MTGLKGLNKDDTFLQIATPFTEKKNFMIFSLNALHFVA